tara:strand:- start:1086 stop:1469 length:384 start_codon:yes stop_codon:yes gene_type:complete
MTNLNLNQIEAFRIASRPIAEFYGKPKKLKLHVANLNNIKSTAYYKDPLVKTFVNEANSFIKAGIAHENKYNNIPMNISKMNVNLRKAMNTENARIRKVHAQLSKLRANTIESLGQRRTMNILRANA